MAKPNQIRAIEQERGESAESLILRLLDELQTVRAVSDRLGVTERTILRWLQRNGYERRERIEWVKRSTRGAAHVPNYCTE